MPAIGYVYIGLIMLIMMSSSSSSSSHFPPPPPQSDCSGSIISFISSCVGYLELLRVADPLHHQMPQSTAAFSGSTENVDEMQLFTDTKKKPDNMEMQTRCCASIREQLMVPSVPISDGAPAYGAHGEGSGSNLTCTCGAMDAAYASYPSLRTLIPSVCGLDAGFIQARCPNSSPASPPISGTGPPSETPSPLALPLMPPSPSSSPSAGTPSPRSYSPVSSPPATAAYPGGSGSSSGAEGPDSKKKPEVPPPVVDESGMLASNQTPAVEVPAPSMSASGPVLPLPPTVSSGSSPSPSPSSSLYNFFICMIIVIITALALHAHANNVYIMEAFMGTHI